MIGTGSMGTESVGPTTDAEALTEAESVIVVREPGLAGTPDAPGEFGVAQPASRSTAPATAPRHPTDRACLIIESPILERPVTPARGPG